MFVLGWTTGSVVTRFAASRAGGGRINKTLLAAAAMGQGCGPSKMINTGNSSNSSKGEVPPTATTMADENDQYYDRVVCRDADIQEGQMKEVALGAAADGPSPKCLLVRQNGCLTALSPKCTHFGAPLIKGSLGEGVVRCPWHGACFDVTTGDIEDFPGLDSLHKYDVSVDDDGQVRVRAKKSIADGGYRTKSGKCPSANLAAGKTVVIVGGGPAAQSCAETLRNRAGSAWDGKIVMLTQEATGPYDRTLLSKQLTKTAQDLLMRKPQFYQDEKIELRTDSKVVSLDTEANSVTTAGGDIYPYDYLVLASGSRPRTLASVKGATTVDNIFVLRCPTDGNRIAEKAEGKKVVIIGASFIGMEVAAFLSTKSGATSVTVVGNTRVPFGKSLGDEVGDWIMRLHQSKGNVQFAMGSSPTAFVGDADGGEGGSLTKVVLADGTELEADLCVLGVGVDPNTDYLPSSSAVKTDQRGYVEVDENMRSVSVPNVYAVGDIAKFPLNLPFNKTDNYSTVIGHWQLALRQGKTAGLNVGSEQPARVNTVPFFWSMQYGKSLRYAGHLTESTFDDVIVDGSLEDVDSAKFVAYYMQGDNVAAVASLMRDPVAADFANLSLEGKVLTRAEAVDPEEKWRSKYSLQAKA